MKSNNNGPPAGDEGSEPVGDRIRIFRRGRVWHANFQFNGKQNRVSLKTTSKKEARRRAIRLEADLDAGHYTPRPPAGAIADVITAYHEYLRTEGRAKKTLTKYKKVLERLADPRERRRARTMLDLNLKLVDAYRTMRVNDGVAPKTLYTESVIIRQLVNFALVRDMVPSDTLKGLRLKKPKPTPQPCWTYEEVQKILAASSDALRPVLTLLAETGMRFGELEWLTWEDIDLDQGVAHIRPKDGWKPKTGDQRTVPLSPTARQVLKALPRPYRWVMTAPPSKHYPKGDRQISERRVLAALKRVLKKLHVPGKLHTFRHTFISNALMRGIAEAMVRQWVGHCDREIIKLYTHIHDSASRAAMQRLAEANQQPLQSGEPSNGSAPSSGSESAQNQHSEKEGRDGQDAK